MEEIKQYLIDFQKRKFEIFGRDYISVIIQNLSFKLVLDKIEENIKSKIVFVIESI